MTSDKIQDGGADNMKSLNRSSSAAIYENRVHVNSLTRLGAWRDSLMVYRAPIHLSV